MRTFFRRELRRQSPVAVASLFLGALVTLLLFLADGRKFDRGNDAWTGFAVSVITATYLLGIASVAPDAESGATAFLATLPLPRWRELLVRWGVALLLSSATAVVAAALPLYVLRDVLTVPRGNYHLKETVPRFLEVLSLGGIALAAGLLGSVAVRKTLVAFVTAPLFLIALAIGYAFIESALHAPSDFRSLGYAALVPVLLVAAAATHLKGDIHRPSLRPLGMASVVLGGALVLSLGVISTAYAYERVTASWVVDPFSHIASADGRRVSRVQRLWAWASHSETRCELLNLDTGTIERTFGAGLEPTSLSPGGDTVLLAESADLSFRVENLATGELLSRQEAPPAELDSANPGPGPSLHVGALPKAYPDVVWHGRTPYYVRSDRLFGGGSNVLRFPVPARPESSGGSRVILRRAADEKRVLWDLGCNEGDPMTVSDLATAETVDAALSPDGRFAVLLVPTGDRCELRWADLDASTRAWNVFPVSGVVDHDDYIRFTYVSFSPSGSRAFVSWETGPYDSEGKRDAAFAVVDLATNTGRSVAVPRIGHALDVGCWSSGETKVVLEHSLVVDLSASSPEAARTVPLVISAFVDDRHVLASGDVIDLGSLAKVPFGPGAVEHKR